eukprot:Phypoly_transcript_12110.p1 GENE.Phypoly_transcript_12110~~Phypoly_transcript_12110.p1  ORF type:complete len:332 (+),score=99.30 Phypoly_transcript_12110:120-1115(+)
MTPNLPTSVVVHPLVLLSTVDHYNRVAKETRKRVVGVLLGTVSKGVVDVTNSYAVPFEEDEQNPSIWFLDHNFHENMWAMFKKVNARENVIGWYSTGPKIRPADLEINELFRRYTPNPVLVIIEVQPKDLGIPTKAYVAVEEANEETQETRMAFQHIPSEIGALEAEEVGVEHLLRDVKDTTISTLATRIHDKLASLKSLISHLHEMNVYLQHVVDGKLPINHQIIGHLQDIFNLSPNLNVEQLVKAFAVKTNDSLLVIYLSSLIRSVIALHNLILNKLQYREAEKKADSGKEEEKKDEKKEGEKKEGDKKEGDKKEGEKKEAEKGKDSKK